MPYTRIKICGITRPEDGLAAAEAGADAIGLVFHPPAKRCISVETARQILDVLPPFVTPVGIFVDASIEQITSTARQLNLRHIQLNGHEPPEQMAQLSRQFVILKAIRVERDRFEEELAAWRTRIAAHRLTNIRGITLDTGGTPQAGGTGIANDWTAVRAARDKGLFDGLPALIAAGGLTPATVGDVVRQIRPYAVDVSSGVEESLGRKSSRKIVDFVRAVRDAELLVQHH